MMLTLRQKKKVKEWAGFLIKTLIGLLFVSPLIIGLIFSFQSEKTLSTFPLRVFGSTFTMQNYVNVFSKLPLLGFLKNSVIVCLVTIFAQIVISCLAAYSFVFFDFPLKKLLFTLVVSTMMIPGEVVVITNYVTIQNLNMINTYAGLILPSMISGTAIFLMRQYFLTIPRDFKDAATIDGCGDMAFLFRIAVPLSIPTIISLAIYLFVQIYNQFFWPLLVTNTNEMRTIQIGIGMLVTGDIINYGNILAGAIVAIVPSVIVYIFGQDYIVKGMTAGGIKG